MTKIHREILKAFDLLIQHGVGPEQLYEQWWSGPRSSVYLASLPKEMHPTVGSRYLFSDGSDEIHTVGQFAVRVKIGEVIHHGDGTAAIQRWKSWSSSAFIWRQGKCPMIFPRGRQLMRCYIPTQDRAINILADSLADRLDQELIPFQFKYRREIATYHDALVIWFEPNDFEKLSVVVNQAFSGSNSLTSPPPLTFISGVGGYSEQRADGSSLGWTYSTLLWSLSKSAYKTEWSRILAAHKINSEEPWKINSEISHIWGSNIDD